MTVVKVLVCSEQFCNAMRLNSGRLLSCTADQYRRWQQGKCGCPWCIVCRTAQIPWAQNKLFESQSTKMLHNVCDIYQTFNTTKPVALTVLYKTPNAFLLGRWDRGFEAHCWNGRRSAFFYVCVALCGSKPCDGPIPHPRSPILMLLVYKHKTTPNNEKHSGRSGL